MRLVMTMMVRDEVDIVAAVVEHHLDQGVDVLIVTDNGSVDGTTQVLQSYADRGFVELHHDPRHHKQQGEVVTGMARRAAAEHGADWVINGDADEFLVARNRSLTVRDALAGTPLSLKAFTVPVVNMVGPPAERGSGVDRLLWRDGRGVQAFAAMGIRGHWPPNTIHIGDPGVHVGQGNHFASIPSAGQPPDHLSLEVLHLPWRSWTQLEQKVMHAGRGYEANPDLRPSRNHHGMLDYRRAQAGRLRDIFALRMPQLSDLEHGTDYRRDDWLSHHLRDLAVRARSPTLIDAVLDSTNDEVWSPEGHRRAAEAGAIYMAEELKRLRRPNERARRLASKVRKDLRARRARS